MDTRIKPEAPTVKNSFVYKNEDYYFIFALELIGELEKDIKSSHHCNSNFSEYYSIKIESGNDQCVKQSEFLLTEIMHDTFDKLGISKEEYMQYRVSITQINQRMQDPAFPWNINLILNDEKYCNFFSKHLPNIEASLITSSDITRREEENHPFYIVYNLMKQLLTENHYS